MAARPTTAAPSAEVNNLWEAAVAIAQRSILGALFFAFGLGVYQLLMRQEDTMDKHIGAMLGRCLPQAGPLLPGQRQ